MRIWEINYFYYFNENSLIEYRAIMTDKKVNDGQVRGQKSINHVN